MWVVMVYSRVRGDWQQCYGPQPHWYCAELVRTWVEQFGRRRYPDMKFRLVRSRQQ